MSTPRSTAELLAEWRALEADLQSRGHQLLSGWESPDGRRQELPRPPGHWQFGGVRWFVAVSADGRRCQADSLARLRKRLIKIDILPGPAGPASEREPHST